MKFPFQTLAQRSENEKETEKETDNGKEVRRDQMAFIPMGNGQRSLLTQTMVYLREAVGSPLTLSHDQSSVSNRRSHSSRRPHSTNSVSYELYMI